MKFVTYRRVSTARQGLSGLGLEAQEASMASYLRTLSERYRVVGEFVEVESGGSNDRPALAQALHLAKATGATLLIAKLDRLSRNAAFLLALRDSGVRFIAADMPNANNLTVGIMALVAEQEREAISERTKAALKAWKDKPENAGKRLGNPNGTQAIQRAAKGNAASVAAIKAKAEARAEHLRPIVEGMMSEGVTSLGGIAGRLNSQGVVTPRGKTWHRSSVGKLLATLGMKI